MDERLLRELQTAVRETITAKHLGVAEEWLLTAGGAPRDVEQAFLESVADRLERQLRAGTVAQPTPRRLLN